MAIKLDLTKVLSTIRDFDWRSLHIASGDAADVPDRLIGLISADTEQDAKFWYYQIENHVVVQEAIYESAPPCLHVLIASLDFNIPSDIARVYIYELILSIVRATSAADAIARGNCHLTDECKSIARSALATLRRNTDQSTQDIFDWIIRFVAE